MIDPLPEDSAIVFKLIKSHSGIKGEYLILETGFKHDRLINAIKVLVLNNLVHVVYADPSDPLDFKTSRFYPKI